MSKRIMLKNVRLSFPSLHRTETYEGADTGKYTSTLIIDKDEEMVRQFVSHAKAKLLEKYESEDKVPKIFKSMLKDPLGAERFCLRDGDDTDYDGYAGMLTLKATNRVQPRLLSANKTEVDPEHIEGVFYSGCYVNASVDLWIQDNGFGKRINANLMGVQFHADGEPFGAGGIPSDLDDDFEVTEVTEEDFDDDDIEF